MFKYNGCIDINRLTSSYNNIDIISQYLFNRNLSSYFIDIENVIKDTNGSHNNCITDYKGYIDDVLEKLENVKHQMSELDNNLKLTIDKFSKVEEFDKNDISSISNIYSNTKSGNNIGNLINDNNFNISNSVTSYNKQNSLSDLSNRYMDVYKVSREDADTLATLKSSLNDIRKTTNDSRELASISKRLSVIEDKYNINLRTDAKVYNTWPIGLGIASSGITGAVGSVIIDGMKFNDNKTNSNISNIQEYHDDTNLDTSIKTSPPNDTIPTTRYRAERDNNKMDKFYGENYYRDDDLE